MEVRLRGDALRGEGRLLRLGGPEWVGEDPASNNRQEGAVHSRLAGQRQQSGHCSNVC